MENNLFGHESNFYDYLIISTISYAIYRSVQAICKAIENKAEKEKRS